MDMAHGADANVSRIALGVHTATHIDAPVHFEPGTASIDQLPFEAGVGPARVLEIAIRTHHGRELEPHAITAGERLLFKTANSPAAWRSPRFVEDAVHLTVDARGGSRRSACERSGYDYLSVGGFAADNGVPVHTPLVLVQESGDQRPSI